MRIAIVTQGFSTGGGVPTIVKWLRTELTTRGHEVHVHDLATSWKDDRSRRLLHPASWDIGLVPDAHPTDQWLIRWGANFPELEGQRYRPRRLLTAALNKYDLVQVVAGAPALATAVANARPAKVLQVATDITSERSSRLAGMPWAKRLVKTASLPLLRSLEQRALHAVDQVLVENRAMEHFVRASGQRNVTYAPPGIDTKLFQPTGPWSPTKPIIAFGRLGDARKDWPTAVAAFELFVDQTGATNELVIAGKAPVSRELRHRLERSPLRERIRLQLDVPQSTLPGLLASGSVFLQASLEEGLGLAGLEAMACGLPVVTTRTAGSTEYVRDGENGYLVEIGPTAREALARGLTRALEKSNGRALSAQALVTTSDYFSTEIALDRFLNIYHCLT